MVCSFYINMGDCVEVKKAPNNNKNYKDWGGKFFNAVSFLFEFLVREE